MSFLSGSGPRIIAHRGLALDAPENTLLAFLKALSAGATHLETDVHVSADGVAVVSHDPDLARVADRAVSVGQLMMSELRRVDLGSGQAFCSLADALDAFPEARFNIDVKEPGAAAPTVAAIREARAQDRVLVTSFSRANRRAVLDHLPTVATSPSAQEFLPALLGARLRLPVLTKRALRTFVAVQVPERRGLLRIVTPRTIEAFHDAATEVHVWTVNEPAAMARLLDLGVDGIVTDRCDLLTKAVQARGGSR